ncbi:HEAT repeat domain-containing protein [Sandaracinus amylolyticus]|uniref:HEAT repeat domain-containing protein n=1 Tax=Sandaracinus amylolyticus TaxID=927083 RepID=A0A0F6YIA3_9BACT|nr:HEAT repeat domain-containing protein [Sandaracinus amylolyticus]AKF05682.1 hypothetical protein DB32_002831 [Sandaracinus amylolyticus]
MSDDEDENSEEYVVLYPQVTREDFERVASELRLVRHHVYEPQGDKEPYEQVWADEDQSTAVHYVEDPISGTHHLWVRGYDTPDLAVDLATRLLSYYPEQLIELARDAKTHDDRVKAIFRLAAGFRRFDPDAFDVFDGYVRHTPDPLLQRATLNAIAMAGWPELVELVERATADEDEQVRQTATRLLEYLRTRRDG